MSDADTIREALPRCPAHHLTSESSSLCPGCRACGTVLDALDRLEAALGHERHRHLEAVQAFEQAEAERDEALRDWQMYVHEIEDEKARAEAAEAEIERLKEQLRQTEMALEEAVSWNEIARAAMRETIMQWRKAGMKWSEIKAKPLWKAFIKIGGS